MPNLLDLRFAVGSDSRGVCSALWHVTVTSNGHLIATVRGMHGIAKFTLHGDQKMQDRGEGRWCTFGPSKEHYERMPALGIERDETGRALWTWRRPEGPAKGVAPALRIAIPRAFLHPSDHPSPRKSVTWLNIPAQGEAAFVWFLYTRADRVTLRNISSILGWAALPSGEKVIIAVSYHAFDATAFRRDVEPKLKRIAPRFLTANRDLEVARNLCGLFFCPPHEQSICETLLDASGLAAVRDSPPGPWRPRIEAAAKIAKNLGRRLAAAVKLPKRPDSLLPD